MGTITRGVAKIEFAPPIAGAPGTVFEALGLTDRDNPVTQIEADPTLDYLYSHELDPALDTEVTAGEMPFVMTVVDPSLATFAKVFGGTVTGTGGTATYGLPRTKLLQNFTVRITPKKGLIYTINYGSVYGKINADFAKAGKLAIDVVVQPLLPPDEDTDVITIGPLVA